MRSTALCLVLVLTLGLAAPAAGQAAQGLGVFQLSSEAIPDDVSTAVTSAAGHFVAVWASGHSIADDWIILARHYDDAGQPRGDVFQVNTRGGDHSFPAVASDAAGNFVVAWTHSEGSTVTILARCYDDEANPLGEEIEVAADLQSDTSASVARDASGNFVVVWAAGEPSSSAVFARRYDPFGLPRGDAFRVSTNEWVIYHSALVAADAAGDFVVVWIALDEHQHGIFARRYGSDGQVRGDQFRVNTLTAGFQNSPAVASDQEGNFVVTWASVNHGISEREILLQRYDGSGQPLGNELRVVDSSLGDPWSPAVAFDAAGGFLVLWNSAGPGSMSTRLFGQHFSHTGTAQGPVFRLDTAVYRRHGAPAVAADASGTFVAIYTEKLGSNRHHVLGRRLPPQARAGTFHLGAEFHSTTQAEGGTVTVLVRRTGGSAGEVSVDYLTVDGTATAHEDYVPSAGTLTFADGDWEPREVSVTFLQDEVFEGNENLGVQLVNPSDGAFLIAPTAAEITILDDDFGPPGAGPQPLGPAFAVGDEEASERRAPAVVTAANGDTVIVWESRDDQGEPLGIFGRSYDAQGTPKGPSFRVSTDAGTEPAVAADDEGNFIVAWEHPDTYYTSVRARRFNSEGVAVGDEFEIAAYGTAPEVARLEDGNDVVVWQVPWSDSYGFYVSLEARVFDAAGVPLGDVIYFRHEEWFVSSPGTIAVAADQPGNFVITGHLDDVWARRYDAAGMPRSERFEVASDASSLQPSVGLAMNPAGDFVVAWDQEDAAGIWTDIVARRYAHDGTPIGEPFRVNRTPANDQKWRRGGEPAAERPRPGGVARERLRRRSDQPLLAGRALSDRSRVARLLGQYRRRTGGEVDQRLGVFLVLRRRQRRADDQGPRRDRPDRALLGLLRRALQRRVHDHRHRHRDGSGQDLFQSPRAVRQLRRYKCVPGRVRESGDHVIGDHVIMV
ncbi:MAG: hypothetical protein GY856_18285 [bacterium]|nr:hypothetical protein [bacterium]